jgi:hypothetical protein
VLTHTNGYARSVVSSKLDEPVEITLPIRLDFDENFEATVSRLNTLRSASAGLLRVKKLRFDELKFISPAAALVLASEVDKWNQLVQGRLRADVDSWDPPIRRLLSQMGYFDLLGLSRPVLSGTESTVSFLKFRRGGSGESDSGKMAKDLRIDVEKIVGKGISRHHLFEGLSEAITNVIQHAYPPSMSSIGKQWWLSASFDRNRRNLHVMFYDQGVGIPNTLPTSHLFESMKALFSRWSDSEKIQAAMEYGRSSVGEPQRGKGLQNLLEFARVYDEGRLSIYSRNGLYRVEHTRDNKIETIKRDHKRSIGGTLIEWSVKL